jgi:hypothetical protein
LLKWNADSADGKIALTSPDDENDEAEPAAQRLLLSENPIDAIWLRLRQLQSVSSLLLSVSCRSSFSKRSLGRGFSPSNQARFISPEKAEKASFLGGSVELD